MRAMTTTTRTTTADIHALRDALTGALDRFRDDAEGALAALLPLYDEAVRFRDPLQTLEGRDAFAAMNRRLLARSRSIAFDVSSSLVEGDRIALAWRMDIAWKVGPAMSVEGMTHLRVTDGKIVDHRDYWDLLGAVADAVPLAGPVWRAIAARFG